MPISKATASRIDIKQSECVAAVEYRSLIEQLLQTPEFRSLAAYRHHKMNRQQHSFNVSWYAFRLARFCRWDAAAVARSGLLHDLFTIISGILIAQKMNIFMLILSKRWLMLAG